MRGEGLHSCWQIRPCRAIGFVYLFVLYVIVSCEAGMLMVPLLWYRSVFFLVVLCPSNRVITEFQALPSSQKDVLEKKSTSQCIALWSGIRVAVKKSRIWLLFVVLTFEDAFQIFCPRWCSWTCAGGSWQEEVTRNEFFQWFSSKYCFVQAVLKPPISLSCVLEFAEWRTKI